jgi:hypothetical protein
MDNCPLTVFVFLATVLVLFFFFCCISVDLFSFFTIVAGCNSSVLITAVIEGKYGKER